jgi:hypothetical protein
MLQYSCPTAAITGRVIVMAADPNSHESIPDNATSALHAELNRDYPCGVQERHNDRQDCHLHDPLLEFKVETISGPQNSLFSSARRALVALSGMDSWLLGSAAITMTLPVNCGCWTTVLQHHSSSACSSDSSATQISHGDNTIFTILLSSRLETGLRSTVQLLCKEDCAAAMRKRLCNRSREGHSHSTPLSTDMRKASKAPARDVFDCTWQYKEAPSNKSKSHSVDLHSHSK